MLNDKIEITLTFKPNEKSLEPEITEEQVWLIMQAAKCLVESRNTIIEVLGNKAEEFIDSIIKIEKTDER